MTSEDQGGWCGLCYRSSCQEGQKSPCVCLAATVRLDAFTKVIHQGEENH